jgi:hypothetical protein
MRRILSFMPWLLVLVSGGVWAMNFEVEPNNLIGQANPLQRNKTTTAQLYSAEDVDWFKYTVKPKAKKSIKAHLVCDFPRSSRITTNFGTAPVPLYTIGFYNAAGALQSSYSVTNAQCGQKNFKFVMYTPTAGDYYLSVSPATQNEAANTNYKLRVGSSIATGNSVACANKGGLVKWPLPVTPADLVENRYFYCGYEEIVHCKPWVWGCRDDGNPPLTRYYLNDQGEYESVLTPPSGH